VHLSQGWEVLSIVTPEVDEEIFLGVDTEELSYDLDGQDLRVSELRVRTALAQLGFSLEPVVYEAENGDDEDAKIHELRPPSRRWLRAAPSVRRSRSSFNSSKKLAHRVSYDLEGGQVAILRPHAASAEPRNERSLP